MARAAASADIARRPRRNFGDVALNTTANQGITIGTAKLAARRTHRLCASVTFAIHPSRERIHAVTGTRPASLDAEVRQFFDSNARASDPLDPDALGGCFAQVFLAADATGAKPVPRAAFLQALPRRVQMFADAGIHDAPSPRPPKPPSAHDPEEFRTCAKLFRIMEHRAPGPAAARAEHATTPARAPLTWPSPIFATGR
jgi:hypothetical protein